jgi:peptidoglycan/xylan/chitin deacetylase (PgdA/CDA1 family)
MLSRRSLRKLIKRVQGRREPVILMYHRVVEARPDPWGLAVSPDNFRAQLRALKQSRTVLGMDELVRGMARNELPPGAAAITFDDGYVDNLLNALPALRTENVPATLFLATGPTLSGRHYWWDELAARILDAPEPVRVGEEIAGTMWEINLGKREPPDQDRTAWRAWEEPRTAREAAYHRCWDKLRRLAPQPRENVMRRLRELLPAELDERDRPMTPGEVRELTACSLVSLGGHTADHPDLTQLDDEAVLRQMRDGRHQAESMSGRDVSGFAYPYGSVDQRVERLAAEAGFAWACDTRDSAVDMRRSRPFRLPRIAAENISRLDLIR